MQLVMIYQKNLVKAKTLTRWKMYRTLHCEDSFHQYEIIVSFQKLHNMSLKLCRTSVVQVIQDIFSCHVATCLCVSLVTDTYRSFKVALHSQLGLASWTERLFTEVCFDWINDHRGVQLCASTSDSQFNKNARLWTL